MGAGGVKEGEKDERQKHREQNEDRPRHVENKNPVWFWRQVTAFTPATEEVFWLLLVSYDTTEPF